MTIYDVLCQWNEETEIVIKCRQIVLAAALRTMSSSTQAGKLVHPLLMRLTHSFSPGEVGKLMGVSIRSAGPIVLHSALRNVCEGTQATYQPFMRSCAH